MPEAKSLRDLMRIRAYNREKLDAINGTLGTALGLKKPTDGELTETPAIIVFVPLKINPKWIPHSQLIPKKLEGPGNLWCLVDVVEGGKVEKEDEIPESPSELAEKLRGWDEQVWGGSQISFWEDQRKGFYSVGTIASFVKTRDTGHPGLLTNQHVANKVGQKLYHPVPWGTHIATTKKIMEYVEDEEWYGPLVNEPNAHVRIDCGLAELEPSFKFSDINPQLLGVGDLGPVKEISLDDTSILGRKVLRVGRTTGLRYGTIVAFGYEFEDASNETLYTDLLIIGDDGIPFSTHGDSGSLIVTNDDQHNPIALLWGGWQEKLRTGYGQENWTYAIALSRVLDKLNIDLISSRKQIKKLAPVQKRFRKK
jgi:hypothetical protein